MRTDQNLSLMIPRVFPQWVDEQTIVDIFHKQHIGLVYKVSIVRQPDSKRRNYPVYQAFIYFSAWYENEIAYNFQQRIFGPKKQARVVYDDPWYWVAFENKQQRLSNNDKRIMRIARNSVNAWQKLDQLHDTLTECEEIMREIKETAEKQKRMIAEFQREGSAPTRLTADDVQNCIDAFLNDDIIMNEPDDDVTERHNMSMEECIDTFLDNEMFNAEKNPEPQQPQVQEQMQQQQQPQHISWTHRNLEDAATLMLGDELALTETAIDVAENALFEDELPTFWETYVKRRAAN